MMGLLTRLCAFGLAVSLASSASAQPSFDREAWLSDYAAIKAGMAAHYANLDSRLTSKRVSAARLDSQITEMLTASRSDLEAYHVLRDFIELFDDPHLQFRFDRGSEAAQTESNEPPKAIASCADAGYAARKFAFSPAMKAMPGLRELNGNSFPHAIAGDVGIIRIASFFEQDYLDACQRAFRPGLADKPLQLAARAELQKELAYVIASLKALGAKTLLIDLSGNGGGTEWDREVATLFTDKTLVRTEARRADSPCDRMAVWKGERPCDVFRGEPETARLQGSGNWTGPVAVLSNRWTASAAEEFIGWLVENDVAFQVGERTMGAGCGYVDGGNPVALKAAPITLHMSNCARFTAAGVNEIEGWMPERAIDMPREAGTEWGAGLLKLLRT